jgi:hypothetical protein
MNGQFAIPLGRPMMPWFEEFVGKHGFLAFGITAGTVAKWALVLAEGRNLTWRMVLIDILLAPLVVLITLFLSIRFGIDPYSGALLAALLALASDRFVRLVRVRFLQKMDVELQAYIQHQRGLIREEIQTEFSGKNIIDDTLTGKAPADYKANKTRRLP